MKLNFSKSTKTLPIHLEDKWVKQIDEFLTELGWPIKDHNLGGLRTMLRNWYQTKGADFEEKFNDTPGYNEFRVISTIDEPREINASVIDNTVHKIKEMCCKVLTPAMYAGHWTYSEMSDIIAELDRKKANLFRLPVGTTLPDGRDYQMVAKDSHHWESLRSKLTAESSYYSGNYYTTESYHLFKKMIEVADIFYNNYEESLSEYTAEKIKVRIPDIKGIRTGAPTRKAFRKVLEHFKCFEKFENLEKIFAEYSDAICPKVFKRPSIISANPIDFITMSRAKNWTSCHHPNPWQKDKLIDVTQCSRHTLEYRSCYCAGCFSYMLDDCSLVTYTVSKLPENLDDLIDTGKVSRLMFHIGDNFIAHGRLYPYDQRDANMECGKEKYTPYRDKVAALFNVELESPLYKRDYNLSKYLYSSGHQYPDYCHYDRCSVSFVRGEVFNGQKIDVGRYPVCIECGAPVGDSNTLFCGSNRDRGCNGAETYCYRCGDSVDEDDVIMIDGHYYCPACTENCNDCGEVISRSTTHYIDRGDYYVCENCYNNNYTSCYQCGNNLDVDDAIYVNDEYFCCNDCVEAYGYVMVDGTYYQESDVCLCENCGERILVDDAEYAPDTNIYFCSENCGTSYGYVRTDNGDWRIG